MSVNNNKTDVQWNLSLHTNVGQGPFYRSPFLLYNLIWTGQELPAMGALFHYAAT